VRLDGQRVELWDGLLSSGQGSALVRLARPQSHGSALRHVLRAGGFDSTVSRWQVVQRAVCNGALSVVGADSTDLAGDQLLITVSAEPGVWSGFAVVTRGAAIDSSATPAALVAVMEAAERDDRQSMSRLRLPRRHPSRAVDALRVLHALTDPSTGAPVASPTTSLPEAPGGERQFDYRYSWLRDSALGLSTAVMLGHVDAGARYVDFVAGLLDRRDGHLQPLSTTRGTPVPPEREIAGVAGWAASQPVRVGNAATGQRQLDGPAAIIDAVWMFVNNGGRMTSTRWSVVDRLATMLAAAPFQPTSGIWELREPRQLVSEEIARWQGLDRAVRLRRRYRPWLRRPDWNRQRAEARRRVEAAVDESTGRLPQSFAPGDSTPDAATLTVATTGFWRRRDPRLRRLVEATVDALEQGSFLLRYPPADDGFEGIEAAFLPASWWAITALATSGNVDHAWDRADDLCAHLPPLQPEEWDVQAGEALGNTPLLWSHTEAARCLYVLQREQLRRRVGTVGVRMWTIGRYVRLRFTGRSRR
jgi:GH15 family glucan-1,4-alpha-glucosidase